MACGTSDEIERIDAKKTCAGIIASAFQEIDGRPSTYVGNCTVTVDKKDRQLVRGNNMLANQLGKFRS